MERDNPRVFPRPDILIIRTAKLGDRISTGLPRMTLGFTCNLIPGDLQS